MSEARDAMEGHDPWTCTCKECLEYCEHVIEAHRALYPEDEREDYPFNRDDDAVLRGMEPA